MSNRADSLFPSHSLCCSGTHFNTRRSRAPSVSERCVSLPAHSTLPRKLTICSPSSLSIPLPPSPPRHTVPSFPLPPLVDLHPHLLSDSDLLAGIVVSAKKQSRPPLEAALSPFPSFVAVFICSVYGVIVMSLSSTHDFAVSRSSPQSGYDFLICSKDNPFEVALSSVLLLPLLSRGL
jgi:hypothetical protein